MENHEATAWPLDREAYFLRCCREARERRGMSQRELSRRLQELGVTLPQSSIAKLEREGDDRRPVRMAEAIALSLVLHVPLWDLFLDLDDPEFWQASKLEHRRAELMEDLRRSLAEVEAVEAALFARTWTDRMLVHPHWSHGHGEPTPAQDVMTKRGITPEQLPDDAAPDLQEINTAADALWQAMGRWTEKQRDEWAEEHRGERQEEA